MHFRFRYIMSLVAVMLMVTACHKTFDLEMQPGYVQGKYKIRSISIEPVDKEFGEDEEYRVFRERALPLLEQNLSTLGEGAPVALNIILRDVSLEINTARALLIGDSYRAAGSFELVDISNGRQVVKPTHISVALGQAGGVGGAIVGANSTYEHNYTQQLIYQFNSELMTYLYPMVAQQPLQPQ